MRRRHSQITTLRYQANPTRRNPQASVGSVTAPTRWLGLAALLMASAGCGGPADPPRFLPSTEEARAALQTVLSAWRDAPRPVPGSLDTPTIRFVDRQRRPGQALREFRILGQRSEENTRQFTVRLTLEPADDESTQVVRYNVFGKDPIWVFRLEDYERISHWEHEMNPAPTTTPPPAPAPAPAVRDDSADQPSTRTRRSP